MSLYEEDQQIFQEAMTDLSKMEGQLIMDNYDFSGYTTIADVGGGFGTLARYINQQNPESDTILLDLPHVIDKVDESLPDDIRAVKGSFLDSLPFSADLIILKRIIHDWNNEDAIQILKNCREALNDNGKILICDALITDGPDGIPAKLMDIEMLVGNGGRDRTRDETESVLEGAGLRLNQAIPTKANLWLLEAEPA